MKNLEKFSSIFIIAGLIFFIVAFLTLGLYPALQTENLSDAALPNLVPENFKVYYKTLDEYHHGLKRGRDLYIKEGCWHCHSQYIRPVGGEAIAYGNVSTAAEYENELSRPQLFGTRRVGPDLSREAGKRSNDWHFAHLYNPNSVEPDSVMPRYTWYFKQEDKQVIPTTDGIALVAYLQSLGGWVKDVQRSIYEQEELTMPVAIE
jgi:cytochrome c oxidase cbb3-type subunit II